MEQSGAEAIQAFRDYMKSIGPDRLPNEFWVYVQTLIVTNPELATTLFVAMLKGEMSAAEVLHRLCIWFTEAFKSGPPVGEANKEDQVRYKLAAARVLDFVTIMNRTA